MHVPEANRYENMEYRNCGRSGIKLPAISLGWWQNFGGEADPQTIRGMALRAFDLGITHFDLANNYGPPPGSAEENLGKLFHRDLRSHRDELIISSKAGYLMWDGPYGNWGSRKYLLSSLDQSLKRMGLEYVDIFYHHRPDPETPLEESMGALDSAVRSGRALYAGISNYNAQQTREAVRILNELGTPCLIHQPKYSMLNRWIEDELLDVLDENGVGCIPFSPLAQGLLTERYLSGIPDGSRMGGSSPFLNKDQLNAETQVMIRALKELATERGQSLAAMSLSWVLRHSGISSVLIGASSVSQLESNVAALDGPEFSEEELAAIDRILS